MNNEGWKLNKGINEKTVCSIFTFHAHLLVILETMIGRTRVCVLQAVWLDATTRHGHSMQGGATTPDSLQNVQSGA